MNSSELDMNIDNYELQDLLDLFHLDYNFNEEDLKKTKKTVLMTHPDKSKLPKEYFLFFSAAYKIIYSIYEFRYKSIKKNENIFNCNLKKAIKIIGENGIRLTKDFYHTTADPFLFEENGKLYIFYEMKSDFSKGFICAESFDGNTCGLVWGS